MSGIFNTTATLRHTSPLPPGADRQRAVRELLQDHEYFVSCGPHSVECVRVDADEEARLAATALASDAKGEHPLPAVVKEVLEKKVAAGKSGEANGTAAAAAAAVAASSEPPQNRTFRVTDVVHTLPAGLWDSRVVSTYEMTDMPGQGVFVRIRSPMSIVMDTTWTVVPTEKDPNQLELVEEIVIYCSRILVGTVKNLCEGGWQQIHEKMIARLKSEEGKQ